MPLRHDPSTPNQFFFLSRWRKSARVRLDSSASDALRHPATPSSLNPLPSTRLGLGRWLGGPLIACRLLTPVVAHADPDLISVGAGGTDILSQQSRAAGDFRLEYRFGVSLLPFFEQYIKFKPLIAGETTTRQSVFGGGGLWLDISIGAHFALTPQVVVGGYGQGNGKNLGSPFEIRTTLEAGYVFDDQTRLSVSFSHTSDGGVVRRNPGTEAAVISYQVPVASLIGRR